jgi:hypothetical protein
LRFGHVSIALFVLPFLVLPAGCSGLGYGCAASVSPAIIVVIKDAETGAPAAEGAVGTIRDGTYAETLQVYVTTSPTPPETIGTPLSLSGGVGRPGTYTVRVEKPGYQAWERMGVRARPAQCGVVSTVNLVADLQKSP